MRKPVKIISILVLSLFLVSCGLFRLRNKPKEFTYLYDVKNTGLEKLIYTDGVFTSDDPERSQRYFVFFNDGLITSSEYILPTSDSIRIFNHQNNWGTYIVEDSIIKTQIIVDLGLDGGVGASRRFFKILNSKQIKCIGYISDHGVYFKQDVTYNYQPLPNRIDSADCWILKKKWFWTEEAWNKRINK